LQSGITASSARENRKRISPVTWSRGNDRDTRQTSGRTLEKAPLKIFGARDSEKTVDSRLKIRHASIQSHQFYRRRRYLAIESPACRANIRTVRVAFARSNSLELGGGGSDGGGGLNDRRGYVKARFAGACLALTSSPVLIRVIGRDAFLRSKTTLRGRDRQ